MCHSECVGKLENPYADLRPSDERVALTQRLDEERSAIVAQIGDLTNAQAAGKPLPATNLTAGGVVKHLAHTQRTVGSSTNCWEMTSANHGHRRHRRTN